jgi:2-phospho-L-lactate guanylyltransferase (CobY/MobA/RfbA family)
MITTLTPALSRQRERENYLCKEFEEVHPATQGVTATMSVVTDTTYTEDPAAPAAVAPLP